ncbi:MAG TPA: Sec-independent protein translocase protein TatB [Rhodocyclaceae bacterium]|nr:Sec-independent protein translocase protein TatB [Rhodocyclaceae bacterium]
MFSSGELILIGLVALIVIGPERLPRVARTAGHLLGRLQRYVGDVKADINREMQLEDLKKLQQQVADQARSMDQAVSEHMKTVETSLNESIAQGAADKAAPDATLGVPPGLTSSAGGETVAATPAAVVAPATAEDKPKA